MGEERLPGALSAGGARGRRLVNAAADSAADSTDAVVPMLATPRRPEAGLAAGREHPGRGEKVKPRTRGVSCH
ncbi:hypothetical protein STRTUCAR8_05321 [Streptomyces turgidiscabies Car8]|uniref:Uncharacterized protein n=1 Tax=Streptomyces turgidiscabies (strain Car8) TaxID=698760 RepID=L7F5T7_STRT8|nr:hypothetical protein STRTUCAR8_05321 [Streptomyces turgidiscabies Car8]